MTQLLRKIQEDNAKLLSAHLERMESVDRELASLRAEIQRRAIEPAPPAAPPLSAPRRRPTAPRPAPRRGRSPARAAPSCRAPCIPERSPSPTRSRPRRGSSSASASSRTRTIRPGKICSAASRHPAKPLALTQQSHAHAFEVGRPTILGFGP